MQVRHTFTAMTVAPGKAVVVWGGGAPACAGVGPTMWQKASTGQLGLQDSGGDTITVQLGTTTIYVTHDQAEAMTLASRVAVMRKGRLQQFDAPMNIYNCPANRFVAEFVGSPSMNFIEGERTTMGIRPEHIQIFSEPREGAIEASVYVTELMGNETFVFLSVGANKLIARAPADFRAEVESKVWLQFATDKAHFFDPRSGENLAQRRKDAK